jgi:L-ascorbate metabolism protein UlaG (beta-lactamase superfamily)
MELTRTANAGVLLELDGVTILMDGVCREVKPYPATPPEIKAQLMEKLPDAVAFTHAHKDHYDPGFAAYALQKNGVVFGPADCHGTMESGEVGSVRITPITSRHIGVAGKSVSHASFVLEGSSCVWFTGDASPSQWRNHLLPKPDVLIVPYAYCNTPAAWAATQDLGAKAIVLLHMPKPEDDSIGLWQAVRSTVEIDTCSGRLYIPDVNESITIQLPRD